MTKLRDLLSKATKLDAFRRSASEEAVEDWLWGNRHAIADLIEAVRARFIVEYTDTLCTHGNAAWNCERCEFEQEEVIQTALAALEEK